MFKSICQKCCDGMLDVRNRLYALADIPVLVLIYHRVTSLSFDPQQLAVSPGNFLDQMSFLRDNFPVLRFEEDWSDITEPSVVITFDDGYADNVTEALPVLEEVGIPATFFVTTGVLGSNREFWWDELESLLLGNGAYPPHFTLEDGAFVKTWNTTGSHERFAFYQELHVMIKKINADRREKWINQLRTWAGAPGKGRFTHRTMTSSELQLLAASKLATIGAHTVSHTPLSSLSIDEQRIEIIESKNQLEKVIGKEVLVFSYPFGAKRDYHRETVRLCRSSGFIRAASNFPGHVHRWTDPYQIPRNLVRNWPIETFQCRLKEFGFR